MNAKRTLAALLTSLMLLPALAACSEDTNVPADTTAAVTEETNEREKIREEVPADANYNGYRLSLVDNYDGEMVVGVEGQEARSFTDVLNTLKDIISRGWATSFELIIGERPILKST